MLVNILKSSARIFKSVVIYLLLITTIIFMVSNRDIVNIRLYPLPFAIETRLFFLMMICFFVGIAFGMIIVSHSIIKKFLKKYN
jgi:hypothetical protein